MLALAPVRATARATVPALALALALAACSDGMQVGSVHVKSGSIGPAGGSLVVTAADHQELAGTAIVIPPGALPRATFVAIGFSDATLDLDGARAGGPTLYFEPIGLDLAHPAEVTVPYDKSIANERLFIRTLAGTEVRDVSERIVRVDDQGALVTFELDRLGHVQPQTSFLLPPDAGCNAPQCPPPTDAGTPPSCPLICTVGTMCVPATGTCQAICGNQICPQGQGCNPQNVCVAQCGMGGAITFLCPPNQVCNFATGTCHP